MINLTIPPKIGKYKIERPLGQGGMGQVYLALDTRLERRVAIKCLRPELADAKWQENLEREALVLARLNHPNIVQIHDIVEFDGSVAIVTEYIEGRNLHVLLRERDAEYTELVSWLAEISAGLEAAHREGISHNDLKAENILIGPEGIAKINDFGIASTESDPAGDIFALGNLAKEITQHCDEQSPLLDYLIKRMLEKKPSKRPTVEEVAREFRQIWLESTQLETPLVDAAAEARHHVRSTVFRAVIVGGILLVSVVAAYINSRSSSGDHRYVAVLPTRLDIDDTSDTKKYALLASSVQQGLYEAVMQSADYSLVSPAETGQQSGTPREIGTVLLADELLVPAITCVQSYCELSTERLVGPEFRMQRQQTTTILPELTLESFEIAKRQWDALYDGKSRRVSDTDKISEEDYRRFLQLYEDSYNGVTPLEEVLADLDALLQKGTRFLPAYFLYANVAMELFYGTGDHTYLDRASDYLRQADRWGGDAVLLHRSWFELELERRDFAAAEREIASLENLGTDRALILFMKGKLHRYRGEFSEAARFYEAALKLRPTRDTYSSASLVHYFMGDYARAMELVDAALGQFPDDGKLSNLKGLILLDRGELDAAIEQFQAAVALRPSDGLVHTNLGLAYLLSGEYAEANEEFTRSPDLGISPSTRTLNLADSLALLGQTEKARELYHSLVENFEQNQHSVGPREAAQALAHTGQHREAIELLDAIKEQTAEDHFTAALVYALANQTLAATAKVKQSLDANLGFVWYRLPWFDPLCKDPEFVRLISAAGDPDRCPH